MEEIHHGISRDRLTQLIAELAQLRAEYGTQRQAVAMIRAAGLQGDTYLVQCLLLETEHAVWDAWHMPEGAK